MIQLAADTPRTAKLSVAGGHGDVATGSYVVVVDGPVTIGAGTQPAVTVVGVGRSAG